MDEALVAPLTRVPGLLAAAIAPATLRAKNVPAPPRSGDGKISW
ncbi:hypothetical protein [Burkholderia plantarii]|nr:hypothetical protein [Burkholderia plantarii]